MFRPDNAPANPLNGNCLMLDMENNPEREERSFSRTIKGTVEHITKRRNKESGMTFPVDEDKELQDFYSTYRPWETEDSVQTSTTYLYDEVFTQEEKEERASPYCLLAKTLTAKGEAGNTVSYWRRCRDIDVRNLQVEKTWQLEANRYLNIHEP